MSIQSIFQYFFFLCQMVNCYKEKLLLQQNVDDGLRRPACFVLARQVRSVPWWKSKLGSLEMICNTMLFVFKKNQSRFLSYSRTTNPCRRPSDFRGSIPAASTANFLFSWFWCPHSLHGADVSYFLVVIRVHFVPNHCYPVESWTFPIRNWRGPIWSIMNCGKWKFKQWISTRLYGKLRNKWICRRAAKGFASSPD
jgi:hypothetical protein